MTLFSVDDAIDKIQHVVNCLHLIVPYYRKLALLQFPHASLFSLGANAINGATTVYGNNSGKPPLYWLHSLVMVVLGAFGGGTVAPLLIGKPSMIVANDQIIVLCIIAWYLTHHLGLQGFLTWKPIKVFWTLFLGLFRTHSVVNVVVTATGVLTPTIYYPIPLVGPIVVGTALGCLGMFLPFDKGFAPIKNNTPWNLQGALLTATFFHLMVHDKTGFLGVTLRGIIGTYDANTVKVIIATVQIISLEMQYLFSSEANLFTPLHKVLYFVFQVQGPLAVAPPTVVATTVVKPSVGWDRKARDRLAKFLEALRVLAVLAAVIGYVYLRVPIHSVFAVANDRLVHVTGASERVLELVPISIGQNVHKHEGHRLSAITSNLRNSILSTLNGQRQNTLTLNEQVGTCQYLHAWRPCTPYMMRLEAVYEEIAVCAANSISNAASVACHANGYRLAVYNGTEITSNSTAISVVDLRIAESRTSEGSPESELVDPLKLKVAQLAGSAVTTTTADDQSTSNSVYNGDISLYLSTTGDLYLAQKDSSVDTTSANGGATRLIVLSHIATGACGHNISESSVNNSTEIKSKSQRSATDAVKLSVDAVTGRPAIICSDSSVLLL